MGTYCGVLWVLTDGRNSRFLLSRHQLRASAVRRAAWPSWHGRGQLQWRSPVCDGVVTRSVWPRSIKDSFSSCYDEQNEAEFFGATSVCQILTEQNKQKTILNIFVLLPVIIITIIIITILWLLYPAAWKPWRWR